MQRKVDACVNIGGYGKCIQLCNSDKWKAKAISKILTTRLFFFPDTKYMMQWLGMHGKKTTCVSKPELQHTMDVAVTWA